MHHLDVAGGTGDVAFRVLRAIREAEAKSGRPPFPTPSRMRGQAGLSEGVIAAL